MQFCEASFTFLTIDFVTSMNLLTEDVQKYILVIRHDNPLLFHEKLGSCNKVWFCTTKLPYVAEFQQVGHYFDKILTFLAEIKKSDPFVDFWLNFRLKYNIVRWQLNIFKWITALIKNKCFYLWIIYSNTELVCLFGTMLCCNIFLINYILL